MSRFIIVCPARSGSTPLRLALNAHPEGVCFGELYAGNRVISWPPRWDPGPAEALAVRGRDPERFLQEFAFADANVAGFKLLYDQCTQLQFATTLSLIQADKDIRVVHLWRRDLCKRFISEQRLRAEYSRRDSEPGEAEIELSPQQMIHDCRNQQLLRERIDEWFDRHEILHIEFEDLDQAMPEVQSFLGLPPPAASLATERQSWTGPVTVTVSNQTELEDAYRSWPEGSRS